MFRHDSELRISDWFCADTETEILTASGWKHHNEISEGDIEPHEILAGMAFQSDYIVLGNRRERVRQAGNAVTPPAAEVIMSALVEAITGEDVAA